MARHHVFTAAVLGAVLAAEGASWQNQCAAAVVLWLVSLLFDLLFLVFKEIPDTVPVAIACLLFWPKGCWGRAAETIRRWFIARASRGECPTQPEDLGSSLRRDPRAP